MLWGDNWTLLDWIRQHTDYSKDTRTTPVDVDVLTRLHEYATGIANQNGRHDVRRGEAAYTSQTCSKCGHCAKENRESQADFECRQCHARMNADLNAANNILKRGLNHLLGLDEAEHAETESAVQPAYRGKNASTMTCETSTR